MHCKVKISIETTLNDRGEIVEHSLERDIGAPFEIGKMLMELGNSVLQNLPKPPAPAPPKDAEPKQAETPAAPEQ